MRVLQICFRSTYFALERSHLTVQIKCKGVLPWLFRARTSAPFLSNSLTVVGSVIHSDSRWRALLPSLSLVLTSQPFSTNSETVWYFQTHLRHPWMHSHLAVTAFISAVSFLLLATCTSLSEFIKSSAVPIFR